MKTPNVKSLGKKLKKSGGGEVGGLDALTICLSHISTLELLKAQKEVAALRRSQVRR